jgi:phosphoribosylformylglycinamidine synthase
VTLHITQFEGSNALSSFRIQQLLPTLQAIHEKISGISARFVHLVASDVAPDAALSSQLAALLTYGDPYTGPTDGPLIVVSPRLGTVSPWASKATDIAHNCGLAVHRIERLVEYRLTLKNGLLSKTALTTAQLEQVAALLHDRMTESAMLERAQALGLFSALQAAPWTMWMCWAAARRPWKVPTETGAWLWQSTRLITWSTPSPRWAATPRTWN